MSDTATDEWRPMIDRYAPISIGGSGNPPVFCLAPVHGSPSIYRHLVPELGRKVSFVGLSSLGVFLDVPAPPTLEEQAASALDRILKFDDVSSGGFGILGYSMGGKLAYEVSIRLSALGLVPKDIVIIDSHFEGDRRLVGPEAQTHIDWVWDLFFTVYFGLDRQSVMHGEVFRQFLSSCLADQLGTVRRYISIHRPTGHLDNISNNDLRKLFLFHYSQCKSVANYTPPPSDLSIVYLEAKHSENLGQAQLWREVAAGGCSIFQIDGTHTSIFYDRERQNELARCLRDNVALFRENDL